MNELKNVSRKADCSSKRKQNRGSEYFSQLLEKATAVGANHAGHLQKATLPSARWTGRRWSPPTETCRIPPLMNNPTRKNSAVVLISFASDSLKSRLRDVQVG